MIVQCGQCNTKFRLDDAKVKDNGVKVRCSKCRHVFTIYREQPQDDSDFDVMLNSLSSPAATGAGSAVNSVAGTLAATAPESQDMSDVPDYAAASLPPAPPEEQPATDDFSSTFPTATDFSAEGFDFADKPTPESPLLQEVASPDEGFGQFDFSEPAGEEPPTVPEPEPSGFGAAEEGPEALEEPLSAEFDFREAPEETEKPAGAAGEVFGEAQEDDSFFLKLGEVEVGKASADDSPFPLADENAAVVAPETFATAGEAEEQKEAGDFEIRPLLAVEPQTPSPEPQMPAAPDDLPPLPISSRRRGTTALPVIVTAISIVFVIILAGAGFYFLSEGPQGLKKVGLGGVADWAGLEQPDEGKMTIRGTTAAFIVNKEAGEMFVVTGEIVNGYRKPRASVQVRGLLYGPKGEVLARKTAYCGNQLTKEQLGSMPLAKIEAAMNNQFGDSLSNLGVPSGKGIPFVLVFSQLPDSATEYGIEVAGSTVASQ